MLKLALAAGVVILILLIFLIDSTMYIGKVHAGVSVSGISLGGLKPAQAKQALDQQLEKLENATVTLKSGEKSWTVSLLDIGTEIDTAATVTIAMDASRKGNFFSNRFRSLLMYFKDKKIPAHGTIDQAKTKALVADIAQSIDVPAVDAGLVFEGTKIQIVKGQKGRVVDQKALAAQLESTVMSMKTAELEVPMTVKEPAVQADSFDLALQQALTMTAASVTLTSGDESWALDRQAIISYMDFKAVTQGAQAVLVPFISAAKMAPLLEEVADKVKSSPVSASFKGDGTKAWVVPASPGKTLDAEKTAAALSAAALNPASRSATVAVTLKEPRLTTAEAKEMGIKDVLGSFQTEWVGTTDRQTNVRKATENASNVILSPGEVYNFDEQVGPRTAARGFKEAPGITGPGQLEDVLGGGICQVATTLFNAAFFAGLEIVERRNHSIYISHYPKGRDATVTAGGANLRFKNDTKHYILVRGNSDGRVTKFVIYGTDDGRTVDYTTSEKYDVEELTEESKVNKSLAKYTSSLVASGQDGFKIKVVRTVKGADGNTIHKDAFVSTWKMLPREIEFGPSGTTTTKKSSTTTEKNTTTTDSSPTTEESTTTTVASGG